jgi:hypothetical protein
MHRSPLKRFNSFLSGAFHRCPDGSVLTGGGGAPGPVNELNAEIYYPAYLYLKGSGNPAPRPQIVYAPRQLKLGQNFSVTVGSNDQIGKIKLIRVGANTHSLNSEQRLISLPFTQNVTQITATLNASPNLAPPGYYMLFVLLIWRAGNSENSFRCTDLRPDPHLIRQHKRQFHLRSGQPRQSFNEHRHPHRRRIWSTGQNAPGEPPMDLWVQAHRLPSPLKADRVRSPPARTRSPSLPMMPTASLNPTKTTTRLLR